MQLFGALVQYLLLRIQDLPLPLLVLLRTFVNWQTDYSSPALLSCFLQFFEDKH